MMPTVLFMIPPALLFMVPELLIKPATSRLILPELVVSPVFSNIIFDAIVKTSPELTVREVTVHVLLVPLQVPPIPVHEGPSDIIPPVACELGADAIKIANSMIEPALVTSNLDRTDLVLFGLKVYGYTRFFYLTNA